MAADGTRADPLGERRVSRDPRRRVEQRYRLIDVDPVADGLQVGDVVATTRLGEDGIEGSRAGPRPHELHEHCRHRAADRPARLDPALVHTRRFDHPTENLEPSNRKSNGRYRAAVSWRREAPCVLPTAARPR